VISLSTLKCLDVSKNSTENRAIIIQYPKRNSNNQKWIFEDSGNDYGWITSISSRKCLDVPNNKFDGDVKDPQDLVIWQYEKRNRENQQWKMEREEDGSFLIISKAFSNDYCLTAENTNKIGPARIMLKKIIRSGTVATHQQMEEQRWIVTEF